MHISYFIYNIKSVQMGMDDLITIFSQNCRGGLSVASKRRDLFQYIRAKKYNIACLQDVHINEKMESFIRAEWGYDIYFSSYTTMSRGVMILINNNFEQTVKRVKTDKNGNFIILDMIIQGKEITLVNLYGPNEDNPQFYENLLNKISEFENENIIMCGDWNLILNVELDSYNYKHINNPRARQVVLNLIEEDNFVDIWRIMNEDTRKYTWRRLNPVKKLGRLDYFLISDCLSQYITDCDIVPGYRSDHSGIILKLKLQEYERGKGYWKFNNTLLKDPKYIEEVKRTIEECKFTYITNENNLQNDIPNQDIKFNINDQLFLETLLMLIRGNTIKYSSIKKKIKLKEETRLENEIKELEDEIENNTFNINFENMQILVQKKDRLVEIRKEKIEGVMLRSRSRYQDLGEKPSKYFFNLESRNFTNKVMTKLVDEDETEITNTKDILNYEKTFYEKLYAKHNISDERQINYVVGENMKKLSDDEAKKLEGEITYEELGKALRTMKNDKSPGLDGFTVEFFKFFWVDIGTFVLRSLNYGYKTGSLSVTQKQGVITCLPKPNKSRLSLKNWRPISLLNVVYKMASAVIANRIKTVLDKLINEEQKGFISGRFIGENIRTIYDILFETKNRNIPGLLLSIDFEKAFDTVSWSFIEKVLKYFNFGSSIIAWIKLFQQGSESCIIQNGFMSDFFRLNRGCRQGDPISPYIFILCAEILGQMIRKADKIKGIKINDKEFRLSQYADDTQIFLDGSENSLRETLSILNTFYNLCGLKINVEKTKAIWIGSLSNSNIKICNDYKLDWNQGPFKILGVTFTTELFDIWDVNSNDIINKVEKMFKQWARRKLTLLGRITIIKSLALAKFIHLFLALPNPPGELIKRLEKLFYKFLWNSGPDRIKRSIIIKNLNSGGLRMVNVTIFIKALKITWLRRVIHKGHGSWFALASIDFDKLFSFGSGYSEVSNNENPFWRDLLQNWSGFCNKLEVNTAQHILESPLWFNKNLKNGQFFCLNDWFQKGLIYIGDLFDENGDMLDFQTLKNRYRLRGTFLDFHAVVRKIPDSWKTILNNNKLACKVHRFNVKCNFYFQQVIKDKKGGRFFYDTMIEANKLDLQNKWSQQFGDINETEWKKYNTVLKTVKDVKLKDFQYKINNKILVTKSFLFKINKADNDLCEYCSNHSESIYHLFVQCEKAKQFFNELKIWLSANSNLTIELNEKNILFSYEEGYQIKNYLLIMAKYYIYRNKFFRNELNLNCFLSMMERNFKTEKYMACINNNISDFLSKWSPLYDYFNRV